MPVFRILLLTLSLCGLGCGGRSEQSVLLPPQTAAELIASGNRPIVELYNHGPATVESTLNVGADSETKTLPPQVGWIGTFAGDVQIVLMNREEEERAVVDVTVRQADGLQFTQPVTSLDNDNDAP